MKRRLRATIRDVANLAKVSPASVSNVINNKPGVGQQTRALVLEAMEMLNYRPNNAARSLRAKKSLSIGLVTEDIEGLFTTSLVRGVEDAIRDDGFHAFLCNSYGDEDLERSNSEALLAKQVDGLIFLNGYQVKGKATPIPPENNPPFVFLYQFAFDTSIPSVIPDDFQGGVIATEHLINLGHKRIGLINGPSNYEASQLRLEGYKHALEQVNIEFDPELVRAGKWNQAEAYHFTKLLINLDHPPSAIFCTSDLFALGADSAIKEKGLRIPDDISLIGFDNRYFAKNQIPPLTTVELPLYEMGKLAGDLLLEEIKGPKMDAKIHRVPCKLIVRESTGEANGRSLS